MGSEPRKPGLCAGFLFVQLLLRLAEVFCQTVCWHQMRLCSPSQAGMALKQGFAVAQSDVNACMRQTLPLRFHELNGNPFLIIDRMLSPFQKGAVAEWAQ